MEEPGISRALDIVGWIAVAVGTLVTLFAFASGDETRNAASSGISGVVAGICFLGLSAIIRKLYQIEHHLRR